MESHLSLGAALVFRYEVIDCGLNVSDGHTMSIRLRILLRSPLRLWGRFGMKALC